MKVLVQREPLVEQAPYDLETLREHMRLTETDGLDTTAENAAKTAAAEFEHVAQVALFDQTITVTVLAPDFDHGCFHLPIGPTALDLVPIITIDGEAFTDFLCCGGSRPVVLLGGTFSALSPDRITIVYSAGFGDQVTDLPPDIMQAMMDQALLMFDEAANNDSRRLKHSPHFSRIAARYRGVQA
jgi:hypothetical protein